MALAIGLMSGTSLDGMDAALLEQDDQGRLFSRDFICQPYEQNFREALRSVFGGKGQVAAVEEELTRRHAGICQALLEKSGLAAKDITVIGFHGQTSGRPDLADRRRRAVGAPDRNSRGQ